MAVSSADLQATFDPADYGDSCAGFYAQLYPSIEAGLVARLLAMAGEGPVLELGLATGRVALRLSAAGVPMHGIDVSRAMLAAFRAQSGADSIAVVRGDFAVLPYRNAFHLIFSLVSSLHLLPTLSLQAQCLHSVALALTDEGRFVSETFETSGSGALTSEVYPVHTAFGIQRYRVTSLPTRVAVLDGLADAAGLTLIERWSDWSGALCDTDSVRQISVYRRSAPAERA